MLERGGQGGREDYQNLIAKISSCIQFHLPPQVQNHIEFNSSCFSMQNSDAWTENAFDEEKSAFEENNIIGLIME